MSDYQPYSGPPLKSDSYRPGFPTWIFHPVLPARIVVDLSAQTALQTQDPLWTTVPNKHFLGPPPAGTTTQGGVFIPPGWTLQRQDTFGTSGSVATLPRLHALYYEAPFFDRDSDGRVTIPNTVINSQQQTFQHYEDPTIAFAADHLIVHGKGQNDNSIKSAQLVSKFTSRSFMFECKLTAPASLGSWSAFYAYASASGNDSSELDVEFVVNSTGVGALNSGCVNLFNHPTATSVTVSDNAFSTQFYQWINHSFDFSTGPHTYTIIYDDTGPGTIKRYIDGNLIYYGVWKWNQSLGGTGFGPDPCMILELAVGGTFPGTLPVTSAYVGDLNVYYLSYYAPGAAGRAVPAGQAFNFNQKSSTVTLSGGDLIATATTSGIDQPVYTIDSIISGSYYWEIVLTGGSNVGGGIGTYATDVTNGQYLGDASSSYGWYPSGQVVNTFSTAATWQSYSASHGVRLCFAVYLSPNTTTWLIWGRVGPTGNWNNSGSANPATLTGGLSLVSTAQINVIPGANLNLTGDTATLCAAPSSWLGVPPTGYGPIP